MFEMAEKTSVSEAGPAKERVFGEEFGEVGVLDRREPKGHSKNLGFHSLCDCKTLEGFEQGSNRSWFVFLKDSGCRVEENRL